MSEIENYKTISKSGESLYKEKGSKFIGLSFHVENEDDVKAQLDDLRKTYHDARHHCYAYVLGADRVTYRANDDGEPNHSAGDPILGQINSKELTNVLVVVIRYFGGTKLGVSGLINAYKIAAEGALKASKMIMVEITRPISIDYSYEITNDVMRLVDEFSLEITEQQFEQKCHLVAQVKIGLYQQLLDKLTLLEQLNKDISYQ